ncbi:hypothetical protein B0I72DRAFT_132956 [Yarrowia lipolytica]|jgi:hypothetical protein|uniref:YALI0E21043p n=2 Tax=Yarrowia lipolytica TaxID=4952 RepID=Q6C548_YARLI|nr:YALI0E21043p [Yarrowia lipolytica CLIB122]AOW05735.1 hypothetical protein YALI1_E25063g [Yarrowia lipolytica]KAB8286043.1 hypothetical protein BKA91DRAFT_132587 [Yarrowia lipolytica]KAE8171647.1 hypothetical protein BKA90DRAFT_138695 [Yarrowia lipolytica]KAJ8057186.1 hypothetical protein LXG23DRAFT_16031 [Yarrowia lipolytica]RDW28216.1 hypothetical protein B0I71DRAFT_127767 [Yarrowia lipolytica]|eukprot:XP_504214.1 YALI0E21043p [Yarrowia lipolytica CLIB122]
MRIAAILLCWLATLVLAKERQLSADTLVTCMQNSSFTADFFDVKFFPDNRTVDYNIRAKTDISGRVYATLDVWAYGFMAYSVKVDPCTNDKLQQLCPMYPGNIDLESTATLSKHDVDQIPGVGFTFPDIDLMIVGSVYMLDTDKRVACIVIQMTNGKTVEHTAVKWVTACISGLGLLVAAFAATFGNSITASHIAANSVSLFNYFQATVILTMQAVPRVPPMAAAWAQNVAWSVGLIRITFMQKIFRWYIQSTGGNPTLYLTHKTISILVQRRNLFVERVTRLNPVLGKVVNHMFMATYDAASNVYRNTDRYTRNLVSYHPSGVRARDLAPDHVMNLLSKRAQLEDISPESSSTLLVLRGILRVIYDAHIEQTSGTITSFTFFVLFGILLGICFGVFKLFQLCLQRKRGGEAAPNMYYGDNSQQKEHDQDGYRHDYYASSERLLLKGALSRTLLLFCPQLLVFSLWEFYTRDSAAVIVLACFFLVLTLGVLCFVCFRVVYFARKSIREHNTPAYLLFGNPRILNRYGFMYLHFNANHYWYCVLQLAYTFVKAIFIAYGQQSGKTQAMAIFIIELFYFALLCWRKPYMDKRTNALNIAISLVTLINSFLFTFFSRIYGQPASVSSVMGVIFFILNAAFSLVLLIIVIVTCTIAILSKNPDKRYHPAKDDRAYFMPNQDGLHGDNEFNALGNAAQEGHDLPFEEEIRDNDDSNSMLGVETKSSDDLSMQQQLHHNNHSRHNMRDSFRDSLPSGASFDSRDAPQQETRII